MTVISLTKKKDLSIINIDDGKVNACCVKLLTELTDAITSVDNKNRVLCLTGRPGFFSAGFDLNTFKSGNTKEIKTMTKLGFELLLKLYSFPRPVIMACTGHAIGLGLFLLCCADYRIGVSGTFKIQANELKNKMIIPSQLLHIAESRILKNHIYRILLNAEAYDMNNSLEAGLIDEIVEVNQLEKRILEKSQELCQLDYLCYEQTKLLSRGEIIHKTRNSINKWLKSL